MPATGPNRRLLAVLCADLADYSRLVRADEEGTLAEFAGHLDELVRPAIDRHRGRLVKTLGDGFLATFESPVEAARCAVAIQDGMAGRTVAAPPERRQQFRIGVNLGDIVLTADDIFGDGVNVAARLQALADPGGVLLSAAAYDQVRDHLDRPGVDLGEKALKNIDRPVRVYRLGGTVRRQAPRRAMLAAAAVLALALAVAASWWLIGRTSPPPPLVARPGIAVLPFANQSGDPAQEYFSEGITDDVIAALGRFSSLTVMAHNAVFAFKGKSVAPAEIGRALGVRYLVEGSVRKLASRIRVSAQLTDAAAGKLLWSEQFDEELKDVFAVQDTIVRRIAGTLAANLTRIELRRASAKPTENLDAYDLVLRARVQLFRNDRRAAGAARTLLERAIELDRGYAGAYTGLALVELYQVLFGWTEFPDDTLTHAEALVQRAIELDDTDPDPHALHATLLSLRLAHDRALVEADRAVALNPSSAEGLGSRGSSLLWTGRAGEAIPALELARRIDPGLRSEFLFVLSIAYLLEQRPNEALRAAEDGQARFPLNPFFRVMRAASLSRLGDVEAAGAAMAELLRVNPYFDITVFGSQLRDPEQRRYLMQSLASALPKKAKVN